jgi:hypothetical protein
VSLASSGLDFTNFTGLWVEYLPPYSPDLNPIEEAFGKIKAFIRHNNDLFAASIGDAIIFDMYEALDVVTPLDVMGYIIHAGYFCCYIQAFSSCHSHS